jgi:hypothetical protein
MPVLILLVSWVAMNISKEHAASIFRIAETESKLTLPLKVTYKEAFIMRFSFILETNQT